MAKSNRKKRPSKSAGKPLIEQAKVRGPDRKSRKRKKPKPPRVHLKPSGRRWYTDHDRLLMLAALKANGGNVAKTAREHEVPEQTLWCWSKGRRCPEALQMQGEYEERLADALTEIAWQAVAIIPEKMDKAPLNYLTGLLDKAIEKARLLEGKTTSFGKSESTSANLNFDAAKLNESERAILIALYSKACGTTAPGGEAPGRGPSLIPAEPARVVPGVLT